MRSVLQWCADHWAALALGLSCVVQFTPVKWCPWTSLLKWIGRVLTADIAREVSAIRAEQLAQQSAIDENEKDRIRWEVLDFANSCRNGRRHTKDEFQHIIALNGKYKRLLSRTGDENGVFDAEYRYIEDLYAERQRKNDFL